MTNGQYNARSFIEQARGIKVKSNINEISFDIIESNGERIYDFGFKKQKVNVNVNQFSYFPMIPMNINPNQPLSINNNSSNACFLDSFGLSNMEIIRHFSFIQKKEKEEYLNDILRDFDENIESFKIIGDGPQCKINNLIDI